MPFKRHPTNWGGIPGRLPLAPSLREGVFSISNALCSDAFASPSNCSFSFFAMTKVRAYCAAFLASRVVDDASQSAISSFTLVTIGSASFNTFPHSWNTPSPQPHIPRELPLYSHHVSVSSNLYEHVQEWYRSFGQPPLWFGSNRALYQYHFDCCWFFCPIFITAYAYMKLLDHHDRFHVNPNMSWLQWPS